MPRTYAPDHPYAAKIARNRQDARICLAAYQAMPGQDTEDALAAISDLIADLCHLADEVGEDVESGEPYGEAVARRALEHGYRPERDGDEA